MLNDETVFLTGFPGFIAGRLIERLARDGARFLLLVQPAFVERARKEISQLADKTGAAPERFRVLEGDITREDLERRVVEDLIARDARYKQDPAPVTDAVIGAKKMALGDEEPEKIADFIALKAEAGILTRSQ